MCLSAAGALPWPMRCTLVAKLKSYPGLHREAIAVLTRELGKTLGFAICSGIAASSCPP